MNEVASILLHMDGSAARGRHRLEVTLPLAQRLGATVTALYACAPQLVPGPAQFFVEAGVLLPDTRTLDERWREQARALVEAAQGPVRVHWEELPQGRMVTGAFVREALRHDLVVLGQYEGRDPAGPGVPPDFVASVVVDSGRPALVVPFAGAFGAVGRKVLIAWKPSREAARALSAALPLLQPGAEVHVMGWGCDPAEVQPLLLRHGIEARYTQEAGPEGPVGEELLWHAADLDADLLVMGCYGHARARELVLGGASRTVLQAMALPVLMAH